MKKLSDKISSLQGFSSKVDPSTGIFIIENLTMGEEFKVYNAKINDNISPSEVNTTKLQEAKQGSGLAMVESSRDALKKALEKSRCKVLRDY